MPYTHGTIPGWPRTSLDKARGRLCARSINSCKSVAIATDSPAISDKVETRGGIMANSDAVTLKIGVSLVLTMLVFLLTMTPGYAQQADVVTTYHDQAGWKLQVNGKDFYVKGVVWGYSPKGQNYSYNLWGQSDEFIKTVLDEEFTLLKDANINAIRAFSNIPPKWITYVYQRYGIMTVLNPLFGRYGATINGVWVSNTNYQDEATRAALKSDFIKTVQTYKDVPGVLMFALGNESNYGLSWSSFEIENLPQGEQNKQKARYLYSLFAEAISEAKAIDSNHLFTIVNGDIQYLDLIKEYGADWDLLGVNAYRGISFTDLWARVKDKLDLPVIFFEFGSDAFNARTFSEDQKDQALYLKGQWQEMYNKSYGKGEEGNSLGGFVFQWRDEWWKHKQEENLDIHDRTASWSNGGYKWDFVEGQNNMNEEWFGITAMGDMDARGVYPSEPRMAYYVLKDIWALDVYDIPKSTMNREIRSIDMDLHEVRGNIQMLKSENRRQSIFNMTGGSFSGEYFIKGRQQDITVDGENGLRFSDGQMANLDFAFQPSNRLNGQFTLNVLANVADSDFEFRYGDRGLPITVETIEDDGASATVRSQKVLKGRERIEIYDFNATYEGDNFTLESFYHVPRFHWGYKGDFFGLLRETTDMEGQDIWNSKAPYGVEYRGKGSMDGLTVLFGPEIYWGANPKVMIKYDFDALGIDYTVIHSEDLARREDSSSSTDTTDKQTSQTTLYAKLGLSEDTTLELGGLVSSSEKVGDSYDRLEGSNIVLDEIEDKDTLGIKAKLSFNVFNSKAYVAMNYAGLVADSGDVLRENGTELPYSGLGNKRELEGGILIPVGDFTIYPRFLVRKNIVDANPTIEPSTSGTTLSPGLKPRNYDDDPFAVLDNREAKSGEIILTYDPTPASYFYNWNADITEDAPFAFNLGLTYTEFDSFTDSDRFFYEAGNTNAAFGAGLAAEDVYLAKSKLIFNPSQTLKYVFNIQVGKQQSTGKPGQEAVKFSSLEAKAVVNKRHIFSGYIKEDAFGPYDFYRQFNLTYPTQVKLEYARLLDLKFDEKTSSKMGVKLYYRSLDENSPVDEYEDGKNDYMFEIQTYFKYSF